MLVVSPNVGSSLRNVPDRSMTGMLCGTWSSCLPFVLLGCFWVCLLLGESFTIFGTILAELDFVAFISEPGTFLSFVLRFCVLVPLLIDDLPGMRRFCSPVCLGDWGLVDWLWFKYTGILVFSLELLVVWVVDWHFDDFTAETEEVKNQITRYIWIY